MAHTNTAHAPIKNPGAFKFPTAITGLLLVLAVAGLVAFGAGVMTDSKRAWAAFVQNHFYFMSLAIGGLFFAALQWLTGSMWSAPIRRIAESYTAYLPVALVTFVILYFGIHDLYIWSHADHVRGDMILEHKAGYLNVAFFMIRNVLAIGLWIFFAKKLIGNSLAQDKNPGWALTAANRKLVPGFLIIFALTFTMGAFDQLMTLDPHWFSTMFGVYLFAGMFYSILALTTLLAIYLRKQGALEGIFNDNHMHDLGKFMFGFSVFWAYIGFSQFMLIWYANMPEETGYYIRRLEGKWLYVSIFLLVGKFMTPFFVLLPRDAKRNARVLTIVALFMLVAQWVDIMWLVQPEFYKAPMIGWIEIGTALGFLGVFGLMVTRFLGRNNVVAIGDPKLSEAVHNHHQ
jgi:hypothetical protein